MSQVLTYQDQVLNTGDTVQVHQEILEGDKKRVQIFEGIIIAIKNGGVNKSFTVRKIASGAIGVEKIFPLHLSSIKKLVLKRKGNVRRAKLYFLRDRIGKAATRIKEKTTFAEAKKAA